uniref:Family with sequence similarity 221 member B n=1 Tax=Canis lupus familiaris TaxID=9615 RepID=A0A8I3N497_CANLF
MEADKVTEEPHTTMDAEEHPSSKDPSAEDLQDLPNPETPLELSISETALEPLTSETPLETSIPETPLETHTSESHMAPSTSQAPLETHTSETPLEPSISETPLEPDNSESHMAPSTSLAHLETHTSETPLKTSISETPLEPDSSESHVVPSTSQAPLETHTFKPLLEPFIPETSVGYSEIPLETPIPEALLDTHIFKVPKKHLSLHTSSQDHVPLSSPDTLKEDLSEYSSSEASWTRRAIQISEILQKHSLSSPSDPVHLDTSAKEKEEEGEDMEQVDATDSTAHTAQPGYQLGKKKGKKGVSHYTVHPVVPAKQVELVEVAKAMHRDKFCAQVNHLFQWDKNAALNAIQTGLYIGWRCPHYIWDCFRIGDESKCFCGHLLREHQIISEEVGEFWLKRRATFDPKAWRAQCRCKHSHEDHAATGSHPCRIKGCCCNCFESNFLCAACDRRWEEHETFFETEETRRRGGRPHGERATWNRGPFQGHIHKTGQEGASTFNHPIQHYLTLSPTASHTCTGFYPQEQITCLLQRCLPSKKPSSATLTLRLYKIRGPLAVLAPTPDPLGFLAHIASGLALCLAPIPDSFTSAFPSSRDRHCQHLAQASMSLAQISNKREGTGIWPGSLYGR